MNKIEILGLFGAAIILMSMCFDTSSHKGDLNMRSLNLVGSIVYIIYGAKINSISSVLMNVILTGVNIYYLIKLLKEGE